MSTKFTRVSEEIPEHIVDALGMSEKRPTLDSDPYARLKATADQRRAAITRELIRSGENSDRIRKTASAPPPIRRTDWDQANKEQVREMSDEEAMSMSGRSIRRMSAATDEDAPMRDTRFVAFQNSAASPLLGNNEEAEEYLRQASIWNPDLLILQEEMADICGGLMQENNSREEMKTRHERLAEEHAAKHSNWEAEQMKKIKVLSGSGRANVLLNQRAPLMMTSTENVTSSKFGIPDFQSALERDRKRAEVAQRRMNERKAIKRQGYDPEEAKWDQAAGLQPSTYQSHNADWLDQRLDSLVV